MPLEDAGSASADRTSPLSLDELGWDDLLTEAFERLSKPGDLAGRVLRAERDSALVGFDGKEAQLPFARRLLTDGPPTTGDYVVVHHGMVEEVMERRSALSRSAVDPARGQQVLAANIDFVLVVEPLGERWRPRRLERLLVLAWQSGALPVVVLTKADRSPDVDNDMSQAMKLAPGVSVIAVSTTTGVGLEELLSELSPRSTSVLLGRSGAGKSTLANALSGERAALATKAVRSDGKGRHTTVARELVRLENGALLIDTPGVRALGLSLGAEGVADAFADIEELAAGCRFNDCAHLSEPGCAVRHAIEEGALDHDRLESCRRLQREQLRLAAREDPRLRRELSAVWRARSKDARRLPRP